VGRWVHAAAAASIAMVSVQSVAATRSDCWSVQEISAAKVRDLQSMLMVAGLRCRFSSVDVLFSYNKFVNANRTAIVEVNSRLKTHFNLAYGPIEGQRSYDRFTTALANVYGAAGSGDEGCRDMEELAESAAAANGSDVALLAVAEQRGIQPELPTLRCEMTLAAK